MSTPRIKPADGYSQESLINDGSIDNIRSYISEPDRGRRNWKGKPDEQKAVYANRRRIRGERGKRLLRQRRLMLEQPVAHTLETGAMRRVHLRHRDNILKRVLIQYAALNLSLILRNNFGNGTLRGLQGQHVTVLFTLILLWSHHATLSFDRHRSRNDSAADPSRNTPVNSGSKYATSATGC